MKLYLWVLTVACILSIVGRIKILIDTQGPIITSRDMFATGFILDFILLIWSIVFLVEMSL